jgi:hypothetical protein
MFGASSSPNVAQLLKANGKPTAKNSRTSGSESTELPKHPGERTLGRKLRAKD